MRLILGFVSHFAPWSCMEMLVGRTRWQTSRELRIEFNTNRRMIIMVFDTLRQRGFACFQRVWWYENATYTVLFMCSGNSVGMLAIRAHN